VKEVVVGQGKVVQQAPAVAEPAAEAAGGA